MPAQLRRLILPLILACTAAPALASVCTGPVTLEYSASVDANDNEALAVDLVSVFDQEAANQIASLTAAQYFERRDALAALFPQTLCITNLEIAPGQRSHIEFRPGYRTFLFANYQSEGAHRLELSARPATLWLGRDDLGLR